MFMSFDPCVDFESHWPVFNFCFISENMGRRNKRWKCVEEKFNNLKRWKKQKQTVKKASKTSEKSVSFKVDGTKTQGLIQVQSCHAICMCPFCLSYVHVESFVWLCRVIAAVISADWPADVTLFSLMLWCFGSFCDTIRKKLQRLHKASFAHHYRRHVPRFTEQS